MTLRTMLLLSILKFFSLGSIAMESSSDLDSFSSDESFDLENELAGLELSELPSGPAWKDWLGAIEEQFLAEQKNKAPCSMEGLRPFEVISTDLEQDFADEFENGSDNYDSRTEAHQLICRRAQQHGGESSLSLDPQIGYNEAIEKYKQAEGGWNKMIALDEVTLLALIYPQITIDPTMELKINVERYGIGVGEATINFLTPAAE